MRIRRRLPIVFAVLAVAAAVALVIVLRKHAPPEPARLLPAGDGFLYINLQWIRRAHLSGELPAVSHDPEYEQFIDATGFEFERDLEEAAVAIHYPDPAAGAKTGAPSEVRFSEVMVGKIQGERLRDYLHKISNSVETYNSTDIYSIPLEGRTLRVAILGVDTVAASNQNDPMVIRGIIDRSRKLASPFGGPALLRQYYKRVPLVSLAWAVLKVEPGTDQTASGALGWSFLFPRPAVVVASLRYLGGVHFRAEAFTASEADAQRVTEQVSAFLNIFHSAESTVAAQGADSDVKTFFDSLKVEQQKDRAVLTAVVTQGFIRKAIAEPPPPAAQPSARPAPSPAPGNHK